MLKIFILTAFAAAISTSANAKKLSPGNEILWESDSFMVGDNSVVAIPEKCSGSPDLEFSEEEVSSGVAVAKPSKVKSKGGKHWIVNIKKDCKFKGSSSCLSAELITFDPEFKAVIKCWKYKGMTIRLDDNGEVVVESDNPIEKDVISRAEAIK